MKSVRKHWDKASKHLLGPSTSKSIIFCLETTKRFSKANKESLMVSLLGDGNHVSLELNSNLDNAYTYEDAFKEANTKSQMM